jgi:hypothetical protein
MQTTNDDFQVMKNELKTRIDELRVRAHLGGMEVQDRAEALGKELAALGLRAGRAAEEAAHTLRERIRQLEAALAGAD